MWLDLRRSLEAKRFMAGESILIVGKNFAREELSSHLGSSNWQVHGVSDLAEAIEQLRNRKHDVVLVDAESIGNPPWPTLDSLNGFNDPVVLVVPPDTSMAIFDGRPFRPKSFLTKPLDRAALHIAVESVLVYRRLLDENRALKRQLSSAVSLNDWLGCTPESQEVRNCIATAALSTGPVLLLGEDSLTVPEPTRLNNVSLRELIADIEKRIIIQTLEKVDGSQKKAAQKLHLNPTTLHEKMKRYKILPERIRG